MWGTLTLSCLLGLFKTGAPQEVTTISPTVTTMPGSDGTMTSPGDNKMCINPTQFVDDNITATTRDLLYDNILHMRGWNLQELIPLLVPGCGILRLVWDEDLERVAALEANTCPMVGEPYIPSFRRLPEEHGAGEIGILILFGLDFIMFEKIVRETWNWNTANLTQDLTPEKGTNLSISYEEGPWDPVFQLFWGRSGHAGCAMTKYKNSDTAAMSKIFHMEINETKELWNIVCVFRPAGCVAGQEAWNQCPLTTITPCTTPEPTNPGSNPTPSNPTNPNPTNPNPTPPPVTQTPHAAGERIGQRMGFNFESLTILVAAVLSRNLVHMLVRSFI